MKSDNQTIRQSSNFRRAFTLIELLVVVGMIALITGAMSSSVAAAMQRARVQKATADVKMLTQAILAYENYNKGDLDPIPAWKDADFRTTLKFLNGENNGEVPVLIQAALSSGGKLRGKLLFEIFLIGTLNRFSLMVHNFFTGRMRLQDVLSDCKVALRIGLVFHDEDKVKTGQKRRRHIDLFGNTCVLIESAHLRVCSAQKTAAGTQCRTDSCLGDRN